MSVGAYRSRFGLGVGWYFCRCAIGFVIGAGGACVGLLCGGHLAPFFFPYFLRILRPGVVISEWLGPAPIWTLGLGGVGHGLYSVRITNYFCQGGADD